MFGYSLLIIHTFIILFHVLSSECSPFNILTFIHIHVNIKDLVGCLTIMVFKLIYILSQNFLDIKKKKKGENFFFSFFNGQ